MVSRARSLADLVKANTDTIPINTVEDFSVENPLAQQVLKYDGTDWINDNLNFEKQYTQTGTLTVGDAGIRWYPSSNISIKNIIARVITAPTGSDVVVSIKVNGSSVQSVTISDGTYSSLLASTSLSVNYGQYVTIAITQIGSTIAGSNLTVTLNYIRA
jgi:hypothetical protein